MFPLWKKRLLGLAGKGKQYLYGLWLQNKGKYAKLLVKPGVVPGALSVVCLAAALQLTNQYQVVVDGNTVGVVEDWQAIVSYVQELDAATCEEYATASMLNEFQVARSFGTPITETEDLQLVLADTLQWGIQGAVIAIDDCDVIALQDVDCAQSVVANLKQKTTEKLERLYKNFNIVDIHIKEDVKIIEKPVAIASLLDEKTAEAVLSADARIPEPRKPIASRGGARPTLQAAPASEKPNEPLLHVEATVEVLETKQVAFETEYKNDSSLYKGEKKTVTKGEKGTDEVTTVLTLVNGEIVDSEVTNTTRIKEPVNAVIKQGTKVAVVTGSGRFVWPTRGSISSPYGWRWGRMHRGLDIAANAGTAIVAADSGVVVFSGRRGNYGLMIEIDHGNGYVTRYAHCSSLLVSRGARVNRGQLIAKVGRTGYATGNHLHFEVLYRGANKDPITFLR